MLLAILTLRLIRLPLLDIQLDGATLQLLLAAVLAHRWLVAGAMLVGLAVAVLKQGWAGAWLAAKLPAWSRPWVAVALGVAGAMATELQSGAPWSKVLADGLAIAMAAVFGHQVVVEGMRGGRELLPKAPWSPVAPPLPKDPNAPPLH